MTIPEWLYDRDCPGHYMRRIKTVSLSIPSVVGPYASVNCTLSLQASSLRVSPLLANGAYARASQDDNRFVDYFGATDVIDPRADNPITRIQELTQGGCNHSLECTGLAAVVRQAVESLALTGICGVIGVSRLGTELTLDMNSILFGRGLRGIIEGDSVADEFIPKLIALHAQGRFPFDKLITPFAFDQIQAAVEASERGEVVKAVLKLS